MPPQSGLPATTARTAVDVRRLPWIRPLAADYAFNFGKLADFFSGNPADSAAWRETIARVQQHPRTGAAADLIEEQQRRRQAPSEAVAAAGQLRDAQTVAIVTGQQAGLFGGPLFALLKAITAVRLAERVRTEHQVPAVAVFWVDSEDHDWTEVETCGVYDGELNLRQISLGHPTGAGETSVGMVTLDESAATATAMLAATLPPTEFTPALLDSVRRAYRPGIGMADAFARSMESLLGPRGLVVYDAADPAAKPAVSGLLTREMEHLGRTAQLAAEAGDALEALGYHAQVKPQPGSVALFHLDGRRQPVRHQDGRVQWGKQAMEPAAALDHVRRSPASFGPNVLLRPLVQDTLFPTACYVAGPSELAYLAQLRKVYDAFGVPMPLIHQRAAATILDSNAMRFLARHETLFESLRAQNDAALNQLLEAQLPAAVEGAFEEASRALGERMGHLAEAVQQIDATLEGAARSTLGRMQNDLGKLNNKVVQRAKRKDETLRRQFAHARAQAFPDGQPQEREVGFVYFLNKFGPSLVDRLYDDLPLEMGCHWLVSI